MTATTDITDLLPALRALEGDASALLAAASAALAPDLALAASFSAEDVVVLDLLAEVGATPRLFAIDTGRLPEETFLVAEAVTRRYGVSVEWLHPDTAAVEALLRAKGPYSFQSSVEARLECCRIRKVEPLRRALRGLRGWITGQRRSQSLTRARLDAVEIDAAQDGLLKLNPLAAWSEADVWKYTNERRLPRNRLYEKGYRSIGCAPCTRAVADGDDERAGRWWWEDPEHKECGLHLPAQLTTRNGVNS